MSQHITTIKEIATKLNVSVSTVSRALSNHPRISPKTKEAVKKLAEELNYEPNTKAIFFKQKKTFIIGAIVPLVYEDFFAKAISGIEEVALDNGYTILFGQSHDSLEKEVKVVEAMRSQRVDGLLISLSKETNSYIHLSAFKRLNIPVVFFDRVPPVKNAHKVFCNIYDGTVEMVQWLFRQGRKRIAMINGPEEIAASRDRLKGYIEGVSRKKIKVDMSLVEVTDFSEKSTQKAIDRLLMLPKKPDAIISFNDYVHLDAVKHAEQKKIKINDDILFASYANITLNKYTAHPPVVSVDQFSYQQGKDAMSILIDLLNQPDEKPHAFINRETAPRLVFSEQPIAQ